MFDDLLKTQLILKNIITEEDWKNIKDDLMYDFAQDAYYTESKNQELIRSRVEVLNGMSSYIGTLFSKAYIQKKVLMLTDEEIEDIEKDLQLEAPFVTQDQQFQMNSQGQEAAPAAPEMEPSEERVE
tara:strand:- start:1076 stop:1456 length:381 start_codon:yes stop_codon:yes gene_type:complete